MVFGVVVMLKRDTETVRRDNSEKRQSVNHCVLGRARGEAKSVCLVRSDMRSLSRTQTKIR